MYGPFTIYGHFTINYVHAFGLWGEAGVPAENSCMKFKPGFTTTSLNTENSPNMKLRDFLCLLNSLFHIY